MQIKSAASSKVNWTALAMALIGVAVIAGWIPEKYEQHLLEITLLVGPALVATLRTFFTKHTLTVPWLKS